MSPIEEDSRSLQLLEEMPETSERVPQQQLSKVPYYNGDIKKIT
jgi:hypothetical protein